MKLWYFILRLTGEATTSNVTSKGHPRMPLSTLLHWTTMNYRYTILVSLPSPRVTISLMYYQGQVIFPLKAHRLDSYGNCFSLCSLSFSKRFMYMMSHELPLLMRILNTSKLVTFIIINNTKIAFDILLSFSLLCNLRISPSNFHQNLPLFLY